MRIFSKSFIKELVTSSVKANTVSTSVDTSTGAVVTTASVASNWTAAICSTASTSTFTVTDNSANQAIFIPGIPMRYASSQGVWGYGVITSYSNGTVTIKGAPITTPAGGSFQYGKKEQVQQVDLSVAGVYGDSTGDKLASVMKTYFKWNIGSAYLVAFYATQEGVDAGAEAKINVKVNGNLVCTDDSNNGLQLSTTGTWVETGVGINTTNYNIVLGNALEVTCTVAGGTGDATDLTVSCVFVLK